MQGFAWCAVFVLSVLIVASRKHYTVDVLIAWYVVPLVFYAMLRRWTTKRPVNEEPWPHRSLAEDDALQLEEIVVHGSMAAPEVPILVFSLERAGLCTATKAHTDLCNNRQARVTGCSAECRNAGWCDVVCCSVGGCSFRAVVFCAVTMCPVIVYLHAIPMSRLDITHFTAVFFYTLVPTSVHNECSGACTSWYICTAVLCICYVLHATEGS